MKNEVTLSKAQLDLIIEMAVKEAKNDHVYTINGCIANSQRKIYEFFNIFQPQQK